MELAYENAAKRQEALKICCKCGYPKQASEFYLQKGRPSGPCKACAKASGKEYYAIHCAEIRKRSKKWALDNKAYRSAYEAEYRKNNPDKIRVSRSRHYFAHKERVASQSSLYKKAHPEVVQDSGRRRRAKKKGANGTFSAADWKSLLSRSPHCHWCKRKWSKDVRPTHDHVIPLSKGGSHEIRNSVCSCLSCNSSKKDRTIDPNTKNLLLL